MERGRDHEIGRERLIDKEYNLERERKRECECEKVI